MDQGEPAAGSGRRLSGGGYRAMLLHAGALRRLFDAGILPGVDRISSVSGGSIAAAVLGLAWDSLSFDRTDDFVSKVVAPVRGLADRTIDLGSILKGLLLPGTANNMVARAYRRHLYRDKTLQDLSEAPRFVINAANVQSGALWRFSRPFMRDWRVGEVKEPEITLSAAVAASSAFPPVLSPFKTRLEHDALTPGSGKDLQFPPFTTRVYLTDGGAYDNLGPETVFRRCRTVLVSDAGRELRPKASPKRNWYSHARRVIKIIDNQVRSIRKRRLIGVYRDGEREGAYWGIRTDIAHYDLDWTLPWPVHKTTELADLKTRLKRLDGGTQERLINWGHAVCDAALRAHLAPGLEPPQGFPYPGAGV